MADSEDKSQRKYSWEDITTPDYVQPDEKNKISDWIHALLNITEDNSLDLFDELKSGILLCKLINIIKPNTVPNFKESSIAFFQRENIQKFIEGSIQIGVDKIDTFDTNDLFEKQRLSSVIKHIFALNETAKHIGFIGPFIDDIQREKKDQKQKQKKLHDAIISFKNTPIVHIKHDSVNFDDVKFDNTSKTNSPLSEIEYNNTNEYTMNDQPNMNMNMNSNETEQCNNEIPNVMSIHKLKQSDMETSIKNKDENNDIFDTMQQLELNEQENNSNNAPNENEHKNEIVSDVDEEIQITDNKAEQPNNVRIIENKMIDSTDKNQPNANEIIEDMTGDSENNKIDSKQFNDQKTQNISEMCSEIQMNDNKSTQQNEICNIKTEESINTQQMEINNNKMTDSTVIKVVKDSAHENKKNSNKTVENMKSNVINNKMESKETNVFNLSGCIAIDSEDTLEISGSNSSINVVTNPEYDMCKQTNNSDATVNEMKQGNEMDTFTNMKSNVKLNNPHSEEFSLEVGDNIISMTQSQIQTEQPLLIIDDKTEQHVNEIKHDKIDKYASGREANNNNDDKLELVHSQTNDNTNALLIVGGIAVLGIALFVTLKKKSFF